jgi:cell division septum initiation protein DivIVA
MAYLRRKPRPFAETNAPTEPIEEHVGAERDQLPSPVDSLSAYSAREPEPVTAEPSAAAEPGKHEEPSPDEAEERTDLSSVGDEVGAILKAAQEAADRIRRAARDEADRLRSEAESAAAAVMDEAHAEALNRLAAADAEVEQKIREAEAGVRQRRDALHAEIARGEERLASIVAVLQGLSSELENLLGKRGAAAEASDDELEGALRPDRSRVG